ncbi:MAG: DUF3575 domain-containing protein [Lachnospiraceae bacterium]|nr:DUF3575 domain-containing protein [Lachnospiraceae bacterium]
MRLNKIFLTLMVALCALAVPTASKAQDAGLKTNLVGDALLSPNVAVEIGLAPRWTLDLSGELNFWKVNEHSWKHVVFQPEARYWFCERFAGHFLGVHALGGTFNVGNIDMDMTFLGTDFSKLKDRRYQGWGAGAGIAYGYAWPVHKHWNIEAEIGFGWVYTRFDSYPCAVCGTKLEDNKVHNYVGPTKAAVSVVYLF